MANHSSHFGRGCLLVSLLAGLTACAVPSLALAANDKPAKSPAAGAAGAAAPAAAPAPAPAAAAPDAGLKARVETLEEQLVDMQVVVGTLESLAKGGGATPPPFPSSSATPSGEGDVARLDSLETQVRALSAQVQQLSDQIRALGGSPRRSEVPSTSDTAQAAPSDAGSQSKATFGSTTVSQGGGDAIGGLLGGASPQAGSPPPSTSTATAAPADGGAGTVPAPVATAALPPAGDGAADPKQAYETAYGYLLQRDYGAAEAAFDDFLKRFPNDSLAGNAQYWLGETHFVRGQYKAAAGAFLKGYQTYAQSAKAPDSLLKLAMSLDRLGQKDAACSSYAELSSRFPSAPQSVKARAQTERQRVGCP